MPEPTQVKGGTDYGNEGANGKREVGSILTATQDEPKTRWWQGCKAMLPTKTRGSKEGGLKRFCKRSTEG